MPLNHWESFSLWSPRPFSAAIPLADNGALYGQMHHALVICFSTRAHLLFSPWVFLQIALPTPRGSYSHNSRVVLPLPTLLMRGTLDRRLAASLTSYTTVFSSTSCSVIRLSRSLKFTADRSTSSLRANRTAVRVSQASIHWVLRGRHQEHGEGEGKKALGGFPCLANGEPGSSQ